ncbi:MAG TPA: hypothetical protein VMU75_14830 [Acidimicrobiales bacterium]|nr:hypothetical protein [Acidimicrobiales bacterium]
MKACGSILRRLGRAAHLTVRSPRLASLAVIVVTTSVLLPVAGAGAPTTVAQRVAASHKPVPHVTRVKKAKKRAVAPLVTHYAGIIPPNEPAADVAPSPNFTADCSPEALDDSTTCAQAILAATANARSTEQIGPLDVALAPLLSMPLADQLFVLTDLERVSRGLPPYTALVSPLDTVALTGAANVTDPTFSTDQPMLGPATPIVQWGSNMAWNTYDALGADYYWLYEDGPGGYNIDCTTTNQSGCWGHRANILVRYPGGICGGEAPTLVMGAASTTAGSPSAPSLTELLVAACGPLPQRDVVLSWTAAERALGIAAAVNATARARSGTAKHPAGHGTTVHKRVVRKRVAASHRVARRHPRRAAAARPARGSRHGRRPASR